MSLKPTWNRGDYFLLDTVEYLPTQGKVRVWFDNHDVREVSVHVLWGSRSSQPDWKRVAVDADTRGALLVPRKNNKANGNGAEEIPSDVIRAATDVDYRAYVTRRAALWAKRVGRELAQLRHKRGWSQEDLARAGRIEEGILAALETGKIECSLLTITRLVEAMGVSAPTWLTAPAK